MTLPHLIYINPISIRGRQTMHPHLGFVSPKKSCDYTPACQSCCFTHQKAKSEKNVKLSQRLSVEENGKTFASLYIRAYFCSSDRSTFDVWKLLFKANLAENKTNFKCSRKYVKKWISFVHKIQNHGTVGNRIKFW